MAPHKADTDVCADQLRSNCGGGGGIHSCHLSAEILYSVLAQATAKALSNLDGVGTEALSNLVWVLASAVPMVMKGVVQTVLEQDALMCHGVLPDVDDILIDGHCV